MENNSRYVEISLTVDQLRAITKSLSIGADQMAKKINRMHDNRRIGDIVEEYSLLLDAKMECESVLRDAMR